MDDLTDISALPRALLEQESEASEQFQPPYCNTGVRISQEGGLEAETPAITGDFARCSFDWYQASLAADPRAIADSFCARFGGEFEPVNPHHGYEFAQTHSVLKFTISWGGHNPDPNVKATSHHAERIALWLREAFPRHRVSRADVCFDFMLSDGLDYLSERVRSVAAENIKQSFVGDLRENDPAYPDEDRHGRTWYFGSHQSDMMITVYEKGYEMRSKGVEGVSTDLVRLEVRIRPQKQRKSQAASLTGFEMLGFSKWISKAIGAILEDTPTVLPNYDKMEKHPLDSLDHMARQYAGHIRNFLEGADRDGVPRGWNDLTRFLYERVYSRKEREKMEKGD